LGDTGGLKRTTLGPWKLNGIMFKNKHESPHARYTNNTAGGNCKLKRGTGVGKGTAHGKRGKPTLRTDKRSFVNVNHQKGGGEGGDVTKKS